MCHTCLKRYLSPLGMMPDQSRHDRSRNGIRSSTVADLNRIGSRVENGRDIPFFLKYYQLTSQPFSPSTIQIPTNPYLSEALAKHYTNLRMYPKLGLFGALNHAPSGDH